MWFAPEGLIAGGGQVAFAFPGVEPAFEARVDDVAAHFGVEAELVPRSSDLERQGAGIMYVGRLLTEALAELHVRPDVVVGHSLGEWTAMLVAGAVTREAIDRFVRGIADGDLVLPDLVFLALGCGVDVAEAAIAGLPDIAVSHDNCPHQVIVCGSEASVAIAQERLKAQRVLGQVLPFRTGFHTPMFAEYLQPFEDALGTLPLHPAAIPIYSSVSARRFPDDEDGMRDLGRRLYIERVRFRELVENLYADGVRVFVQPGVGSVVGLRGRHAARPRAPGGGRRRGQAIGHGPAHPGGRGPVRRGGGRAPGRRLAPARTAHPPAAAPTGAAPAPRPPVLRFDSSLVRGGLRPLERPAPSSGPASPDAALPAAVGGPLADEFRATLAAVTEAGREVMTALAAGPVARRGARPAAAPPPAAPPPAPRRAADRRRRAHQPRRATTSGGGCPWPRSPSSSTTRSSTSARARARSTTASRSCP